MAVYTHVSEEELTTFLAQYNLPAPDRFDGIVEGVENTNYVVEVGGRRLILTLYEKRVAPKDLPYFLGLMEHAVTHHVPTAAPLRDHAGQILSTLCDRPAALIEFVEGTSPTQPTPALASVTGAALATLHGATQSYTPERPNALGPPAWKEMIQQLGERLNDIETDLYTELSSGIETLIARWPSSLHRGTIHADLFPDNVLFEGGQVAAIIDFYFACTDFYAYDLAITMNAWTPEGTTDPTCAQSIFSGYIAQRNLSPQEYEGLPVLLMGAALRFFLTRAHDFLHQVPGSLVRVKDPLPYLQLFRHHRDNPTHFLEPIV